MHGVKPRARLTESEVLSIFQLKASSPSATIVGRLYGVSEKAIRDIWKGRTWSSETSQADMSRAPVVKKRQNRAIVDKKKANCHKNYDKESNKEKSSCEYTIEGSGQTCQIKASFASILMSVDDQLFEWERQAENIPEWNAESFCNYDSDILDPVKSDFRFSPCIPVQ